ncbi:MAG: hypothetical protein ACK8QZ_11990, partial [Anaerolineales bacterium]
MEKQGVGEFLGRYWQETISGFSQRPIGFYTVLLSALLVLSLLFFVPPFSYRFASSLIGRTLLAILYCWLFLGLEVCFLLYFWLKSKPIANIATLIAVASWIVIFIRYIERDDVLAKLVSALLGVAIPVLAWLWFLRPLHWLLPAAMTLLWFLGWGFLFVGLQEPWAGTLLLVTLIAVLAVFLVGLYIACGFLLPLPDKSHRGKVFNFLRDYQQRSNFPAYVVVDALLE